MSTAQNPFAARSAANPHGALYREVAIVPRATDAIADAPIEIALSSEAPVERYDWMTGECYIEVLDHSPTAGPDLSYARDGLPFCLDHDIDDQVGLVESVRLDADRVLRGTVRQGNHPDAAWIFADMRDGIRKKISIGYWCGETYTQSKDANGQIIRRYTGWTLYEASTVAVPADYEVGVGRSGRGTASSEGNPPTPALVALTTEHSTMSDVTASERGTAPTPDTRAADLAILAEGHDRFTDLPRWIRDGLTVAQVKDQLLAEITARAAAQPKIASPVQVDAMHERATDKPWEAGEFFRSVAHAAKNPHSVDARLLAAQRSQNTNVGTEGGFAVPPAVVQVLLSAQKTGGELLSRVTERPITVGNSVKEVLVKEESRVAGSRNGGLRAYWVGQEGAITTSQAMLRELELNVKKIAAAVPVTEEQIADGPQLISFLQEQVPDEMKFVKELAIWSGSGAGQPLGFMSSGALITQAIEGTQTIANTADFIWRNAANMMTRLSPSAFLRSVWFVNPSLWAKIVTATAGASTSGAVSVFTAPGRLSDAPMGAIYGRPIVPVEYASAEGTVGDFVLADLSDYLFAQKGGVNFAQSMHVEFLSDKQTLKFTERVDGQPRTRVPMTPLNGSITVSPYVALGTRS